MARLRTAPVSPARAALLGQWQHLTRVALPAMAAAHRWPIRNDHCFMRVCLDAAVQARWDTVVRRPATHNLTDAQLAAAVLTAARIVEDPQALWALNRASLEFRKLQAPPPRR